MTNRIPLIAGNWKMNLDHQQAIALIQKIAWTLNDADFDYSKVEVLITPPFTDLRSAQTLIDAEKFELKLGAQDISQHEAGAYTGEISGLFLTKLRCEYVLIGHSERRQHHNEDDAVVQAKVAAAFKHGITPVICIGETLEERENQGPSAVAVRQILAALAAHSSLAEVVVAYEPVWAIGTGKVATPIEAEAVSLSIREAIEAAHGSEYAEKTRILYGGSVKATNVAGFLSNPNVDGVLVGGASLDSQEFSDIARFEKHISV